MPPEQRRAPSRLIVTGDDFGLSESINEGIERAHRNGVLTHASLVIAGEAARTRCAGRAASAV